MIRTSEFRLAIQEQHVDGGDARHLDVVPDEPGRSGVNDCRQDEEILPTDVEDIPRSIGKSIDQFLIFGRAFRQLQRIDEALDVLPGPIDDLDVGKLCRQRCWPVVRRAVDATYRHLLLFSAANFPQRALRRSAVLAH